jgi:2-polyprenyl-6-methoxyphenol hydroxylase-like FAD-dependent oxidoreductase
MQRRSIAIAGAGPAGLAAALLLHRDGHRVTVFERFATPQPVGSGLMIQPTGLAVLDALGLAQTVLQRGHRIDRMFGRVLPSGRTVLDLNYRALAPKAFGLAVHRAALFEPLFQEVQRAGIAIETDRTVIATAGVGTADRRLVFKGWTDAGPFDLIVDALGMRSPLGPAVSELTYGALWTTLPWPQGRFDAHTLEQRYERASVMIGVLPIGQRSTSGPEECAFFWSIKPAEYGAWRGNGLNAWKDRVRRLWPETNVLLDRIESADQMTLARYAHHTVARPYRRRFVSIGDSAHATSPQLGQGGNMALLDAYALALALRTTGDMADALARYATLRRWHVRFYQALSAMFTPFYQSDSCVLPVLRDWIVAPATRLPMVRGLAAAMVAGTILDPRQTLGLGG